MQKQRGFSLVEVMISLTLGILLILASYTALQTSILHYKTAQKSWDQHIQTLKAVLLLQHSVERAGLLPFGKIMAKGYFVDTVQDPEDFLDLSPSNAVQIYPGDDTQIFKTWGLDRATNGQRVSGASVLMTRHIDAQTSYTRDAAKVGDIKLYLNQPLSINPGDFVIITSVNHQVADQVQKVYGSQITLTVPLPLAVKSGARVNRFGWTLFYLGQNFDDPAHVHTALFAEDESGIRHEMVPDIKTLDFQKPDHQLQIIVDKEKWSMNFS